MGIPASANPLLLASAAAAGGLQVSRSLRYSASDSSYLSRTPSVAGNRKTWTWSGWVKRSKITSSDYQFIFGYASGSTYEGLLWQTGSDKLEFWSNPTAPIIQTTQVFRDTSAWFHVVLACDTTQATASNRVKLYINGSQVTQFDTASYPAQDFLFKINDTVPYNIGSEKPDYGRYFDGYLTNIHFIDGQQLTPASFAETDATTGQWVPKAFSGGSYGTNGFYLQFADNSSNTASTLGKDYSGLGNNWTPNNFSVTAGAENDSLVDSPTNYGTDTGVGGEVRGNYATLNPLANGAGTLTNGNLDYLAATSNAWGTRYSTVGVSSGKWYAEFTGIAQTSGMGMMAGVSRSIQSGNVGSTSDGYGYRYAGDKWNSNSGSAYGASYTDNDVIGVALDLDNGTLVFYKNGASQGTAYSSLPSGTYFFGLSGYHTATQAVANFGQRAFAYTAPSGFKGLCTQNLPAPLVTKGNTVFDVALYTGNGSTQSITDLGFNPDLVWIKSRNYADQHKLFDVIRTAGYELSSSATYAESYDSSTLTSFNTTGFSLGSNPGSNRNSYPFVAWCWDAGTSTVTNNSGSISSQVRANPTAGFSVVTYTGNLSSNGNVTVGHGLGVAPQLVITKARSASSRWAVQMPTALSANNYLELNSTSAQASWGAQTRANPTSTVFDTIYAGGVNESGVTYVAYCFSQVVGYSSFGGYVSNGATTDNAFVYTGMRPRWVLIKKTSATGPWIIYDAVRNTYNAANNELRPNTGETENGGAYLGQIDILSNGFKVRSNSAAYVGESGDFIYAAFAEAPFNYSRAR